MGDDVDALAKKHGVTTLYLKRLCEMRLSVHRIDSLLSSVREATGEYLRVSNAAVEAIPDLVQAELKQDQIAGLVLTIKFCYVFRKGSEGEAVEALNDLPEAALKLRRLGCSPEQISKLIFGAVRVHFINPRFKLANLPRTLQDGISADELIAFYVRPAEITLQ